MIDTRNLSKYSKWISLILLFFIIQLCSTKSPKLLHLNHIRAEVIAFEDEIWLEIEEHYGLDDIDVENRLLKKVIRNNDMFIDSSLFLTHDNVRNNFPLLNHIPEWARMEESIMMVSEQFHEFRKLVDNVRAFDVDDVKAQIKEFVHNTLFSRYSQTPGLMKRISNFLEYNNKMNFYDVVKNVSIMFDGNLF